MIFISIISKFPPFFAEFKPGMNSNKENKEEQHLLLRFAFSSL